MVLGNFLGFEHKICDFYGLGKCSPPIPQNAWWERGSLFCWFLPRWRKIKWRLLTMIFGINACINFHGFCISPVLLLRLQINNLSNTDLRLIEGNKVCHIELAKSLVLWHAEDKEVSDVRKNKSKIVALDYQKQQMNDANGFQFAWNRVSTCEKIPNYV